MIPSRRSFLGGLAALSASDRLTMAAIGAGPRGLYVLSHFLKERDVRFVAVSDCFAERRRKAKEMVDQAYGASDCASYRLHERILERKDIDAVLIATGDRWHAVLSCLAAQAGKDVYSEKPFSLTIAEGRALVDTMKRTGRIWQCGTQRKSIPGYGFVRDVVRGGRIGKLHSITTSFGDGWRGNAVPVPEREPDPEVFDYDRWLGQSPWAPYSKVRVSMWRLNWDTSGGAAVDMGPHFFEFAQWVRGDELTGPVEFEGEGKFREEKGINNIPYYFTVRARYADGTRLNMDIHKKGVRFDGYDGYIQLFDEGQVEAEPRSVLAGLTPPEGHWKIMQPHIRNFIDCVRSRKEPVSGPETSQRAHTIAHCANICLRLGRRLRWDPVRERFQGDEEANRMLLRPMRAPWRI